MVRLNCRLCCILKWLSGFLVLMKLYMKLKTKWCTSKVCLVGKTVVVTGANSGIGYQTALEFTKRGARVILACRDETRATQARDRIVSETNSKSVVIKLVNFGSLESVRSFAKDIMETEERIDILVNNIGTGGASNKLTDDGLQLQMQVNYFAHFLLTILLIDKLKKSPPSRIVNVSSLAAAYSKLDIAKLNSYRGAYYTYCNSKLCNILFTMHLAKLLKKYDGTVYSVHPGVVDTEIFRKFRGIRKHVKQLLTFYFKTAEEGAQTVIYTAIQQGIEYHSGGHFEECRVVKTYAAARDPALPERLWDKTVEILKCSDEIKDL